LDLPEKELYDILTAWVFCTWITEIWTVVPYLFFFGFVASGKTRALEVLQRISYRGVMGSNISSASLYRGVSKWHPTIFLDETEIYSKEHRAEIIGLLNSGYRRGQYAIRCSESNPDELQLFDVFGFKALAGTQSLRDTLESRSIIINMMKNVRKVNFLVDEETAQEIRNELLIWRFKKLHDVHDVHDVHPEGVPEALKFADGRIIELFYCLYNVANEGKENVLSYAKKAYERRVSTEESSIEAEIIQNIVDYVPFMERNWIPTKEITERFNSSRNDNEKWKSTSVGRYIKPLGLDDKRYESGRGWIYNHYIIARYCKRYNITEPPLGGTSGTSGTSFLEPVTRSFDLMDVVSVTAMINQSLGVCSYCGIAEKVLCKNVKTFGNKQFFVCEDCSLICLEELTKRG